AGPPRPLERAGEGNDLASTLHGPSSYLTRERVWTPGPEPGGRAVQSPTGDRHGEIRVLQWPARGRDRPARAARRSAPAPPVRAGAWPRRLRRQGEPHLSPLPADQLATGRDERARRIRAGLGVAVAPHRRPPPRARGRAGG